MYLQEYILDNNYYGVGYSLRSYITRNTPLNAFIEHGYIFGNYVILDCNRWHPQCIITFGGVRKKHLQKKTKKKVITIGPYIHYAKDYLNEQEFISLKKVMGKMLLILPVHGPTGGSFIYNKDDLIEHIDSISIKYDTITVCLFYRDVQNKEFLDYYLNKGFQILCAGDRYDWYFLSRLKSIIRLSDYTVSNYPGTHVGYCIYMKKPHWIINQKIERHAITNKGYTNFYKIRNEDEVHSLEDELKEVSDYFCNYSELITKDQIAIVDKYWGLSHLKSKEQLKQIFNNYGI